jgi:dTDP-4-amino-4,6-dideoxygalactose transaminase
MKQFPLLQPEVPSIEKWVYLLKKSYSEKRFSNSGPLAELAEKEIKNYLGLSWNAYVCSSNTTGLTASLIAWGCLNKKVLVSNYTFAATLHSILGARGIPVIADVDSTSWEMSVENIKSALGMHPDIFCIVITRVHGFRRDYQEIFNFCLSLGLRVIVDAAAAFPTKKQIYKSKKNVIEVFSFHATKPLGIGEGGAVVGALENIKKIRIAGNFGLDASRELFSDGLNAKMDEFSAARLIAALKNYEFIVQERCDFAGILKKLFKDRSQITLPPDPGETSWPFFPIKFDTIKNMRKFCRLIDGSIQFRRYYFPSLKKGYKGLDKVFSVGKLGVSEDLASTTICLPILPRETEKRKKIYFDKIQSALQSIS